MLNFEQILIKAAQYLELKHTNIKAPIQKQRFFKKDVLAKTHMNITQKLLKELSSIDIGITPDVEKSIIELLEGYNYLYQKLYDTYIDKYEKRYNWLILKYYVVPLLAAYMSELFSQNNNIDHRLVGDELWYLPRIKKRKMVYPINIILDWWIDLYGTSDYKFYHAQTNNENVPNKNREHTLKDWHYNFVIPKVKTIKEYASFPLDYKGVFTFTPNGMKEIQFHNARKFIEEVKGLEVNGLEKELPNPNGFLDRLYSGLTPKEQEQFIEYIKQRYEAPSSKQLESLLITTRVIQMAFKEISEYFNSDIATTDVEQNKTLQLTSLYAELYNFYTLGNTYTPLNVDFNFTHNHLLKFVSHRYNDKKHLDSIIAQITQELTDDNFDFCIDDIIMNMTQDDTVRQKYALRVKNRRVKDDAIDKCLVLLNQAYSDLMASTNISEAKKIIHDITDADLLVNLENGLSENEVTTDAQAEFRVIIALEIYKRMYEITSTQRYRDHAVHAILNLSTHPTNPRVLNKKEVETWFKLLEKGKDTFEEREKLSILIRSAYHEICQRNFEEALRKIDMLIVKTNNIKAEEYSNDILCIGQLIANYINNKKLVNRLKRLNQYHKKDCIKYQDINDFYYY